MPVFTIQSPSGGSYDIDATSEEHAADYVARRFFSGFEAARNSFDEPNARLLGPFGRPPSKQEDQQDVTFQDYLNSLAPAPTPEDRRRCLLNPCRAFHTFPGQTVRCPQVVPCNASRACVRRIGRHYLHASPGI